MTGPTNKDNEAKVRLIVAKHRKYELPLSEAGIPAEDYFAGVKLPKPVRGAKVYHTAGGPIVAVPFVEESGRPKRPRRTRAAKPRTKPRKSP